MSSPADFDFAWVADPVVELREPGLAGLVGLAVRYADTGGEGADVVAVLSPTCARKVGQDLIAEADRLEPEGSKA